MNLRTWARYFVAVYFLVSGLAETLGATGLVVQLSPDGQWGTGINTLAVGGPLQLLGAAVIASGRKTRLALIILGSYVLLAGLFGNLPLVFNSKPVGSALAGLLGNLAALGGILCWFQCERHPGPSPRRAPASAMGKEIASWAKLVFCLAVMGGVLYWLHSGRLQITHRAEPAAPSSDRRSALPARLLI